MRLKNCIAAQAIKIPTRLDIYAIQAKKQQLFSNIKKCCVDFFINSLGECNTSDNPNTLMERACTICTKNFSSWEVTYKLEIHKNTSLTKHINTMLEGVKEDLQLHIHPEITEIDQYSLEKFSLSLAHGDTDKVVKYYKPILENSHQDIPLSLLYKLLQRSISPSLIKSSEYKASVEDALEYLNSDKFEEIKSILSAFMGYRLEQNSASTKPSLNIIKLIVEEKLEVILALQTDIELFLQKEKYNKTTKRPNFTDKLSLLQSRRPFDSPIEDSDINKDLPPHKKIKTFAHQPSPKEQTSIVTPIAALYTSVSSLDERQTQVNKQQYIVMPTIKSPTTTINRATQPPKQLSTLPILQETPIHQLTIQDNDLSIKLPEYISSHTIRRFLNKIKNLPPAIGSNIVYLPCVHFTPFVSGEVMRNNRYAQNIENEKQLIIVTINIKDIDRWNELLNNYKELYKSKATTPIQMSALKRLLTFFCKEIESIDTNQLPQALHILNKGIRETIQQQWYYLQGIKVATSILIKLLPLQAIQKYSAPSAFFQQLALQISEGNNITTTIDDSLSLKTEDILKQCSCNNSSSISIEHFICKWSIYPYNATSQIIDHYKHQEKHAS